MGKYSRAYLHPQSRDRGFTTHPLWRGIGCLLIILVPIIAFAAARLLVQANTQRGWVNIPAELNGTLKLPLIGRMFYADIAVTFILIIIGFGILTLLYALMYRLFGPSRYGPLDVPPN